MKSYGEVEMRDEIERLRTAIDSVATELEESELYRYRADVHDPAEKLRQALRGGSD